MASVAAIPNPAPGRNLIAPVWHTVLLVCIFVGLTVAGALFQRQAQSKPGMLQQHPSVAPLYASLIVSEWLLVYAVWRGIRKRGVTLRDLLGGKWTSLKDVLLDATLAFGLWVVWGGVQIIGSRLVPSHAKSVSVLFPRGVLEIVLWVALSLSAGISEEIAFRGYFQKQFRAMTGSASTGLLFQAVLFGISHGYQGVRSVITIMILGLLYGSLALWRKSLRPGIIAHGWSDIYAGYLFQFFSR